MKSIIVMEIYTSVALNDWYKDLYQVDNNVSVFGLFTHKFANRMDAQKSMYPVAKAIIYTFNRMMQQNCNNTSTMNRLVLYSSEIIISLSQDFDLVVAMKEIQQVWKPSGQFGFCEHKNNIDKLIVGKVFGEIFVIKIKANPKMTNILAGVSCVESLRFIKKTLKTEGVTNSVIVNTVQLLHN